MPDEKISTYPGHPLWDWGVYPERDGQMPDYQIASWAVQKLAKNKSTRKGTIFWELALRVTNLMRSPKKRTIKQDAIQLLPNFGKVKKASKRLKAYLFLLYQGYQQQTLPTKLFRLAK